MSDVLQILQHSLGVNAFGQGEMYRDHFVAGPGHSDYEACIAASERGLMTHHENRHVCGGHIFIVTDAGRRFVQENSPAAPKLTAGQRRYREWIDGPADWMTFGDFLKQRREA